MPFTKETLLNTYRKKYPALEDMDDSTLYSNLIQKFPEYKNQIQGSNVANDSSMWDSMPDIIKSGYNKSLQGMSHEIATGKKRFDLSGYEPGVLEDIGSSLISNFASIPDAATTVLSGGIGGAIGKATLGKYVLKKLTQNGVKKGLAQEVAAKSIARGIGASSAQFGVYEGAHNALNQKLETGTIAPGEVALKTLGGTVLGGVSAGTGGYLTARGFSTLSRIGAEATALGTGAPLLEGELPTPQDYLDSAGMVLGIKAVGGILKSPQKLKEIARRKTLFQVDPEFTKGKPPKEIASAYAKAQGGMTDISRIRKEVWAGKNGIEVNIMSNDPKKNYYTVFSRDRSLKSQYFKVNKRKFHEEFNLTNKENLVDNVQISRNENLRQLEKKLNLDESGSQLRRMKHIGQPFKDVLLKNKKILPNERLPLKFLNNTQANDYRNSLLKEYTIKGFEKEFAKEGWKTRNIFKHKIIEDFLPKPFATAFEKLLPAAKRGSNDPAMRRYIYDVSKYQDANTTILGDFMTELYKISNGSFKVPKEQLRALKKQGLSTEDAKKTYWANMTQLKKDGKLGEWDKFTDNIYNRAREIGIEIPGYFKHHVPQEIKGDIKEIVFNDLLSLREKQSATFKKIMKEYRIKEVDTFGGIDDILEGFNNIDRFIKENPNVAKATNSLIKKSLSRMNPDTRRMIKANTVKGEFSSLRAYSLVGRHIYNSMFSTFGGLELKRKTIIPDQLKENNLAILMSNYANRAARRIAQVQTFGLKGEKFDALMKGMDVRNPNDAAIMRELQHHVLGQIKYSTEYGYRPETRKFVEKVMEWETGTKIGLGFATIPNISQSMISSALDAGYLRFFKGVMALSKKENRDFIKASGATNYSQLNEMLGVSEPTSLTSGIVEKLGKYTGFTGINKINQYLAASTAGAFVKDLTKISHSGMTRTRRNWARGKLEQLGIDYNEFKGGLDINKVMKMSKGSEKRAYAEKKIKVAMERFARNTQLQKDILKDPLMLNNPMALPFVQFKRFGYRQATYLKDMLKYDVAHGRLMPIARLGIAGFAGGAGVNYAKKLARDLLSGENTYDPNLGIPKDMEEFIDNLSAVGALGVVGDIFTPILEDEKSTANAIKFAITPAFVSDIENLFTKFLYPMGNDFKNFHADAILRAPTRLAKTGIFGGSVVKEGAKRFETTGLKEQRIKSLKSRALSKILTLLENKQYDKAYEDVQAWNQSYASVQPITSSDINVQALIARKKRKLKRKL